MGNECLAREFALQHHLCALWEDGVIKRVSGVGYFVEFEFPQGGEVNQSTGRRVVEVNLSKGHLSMKGKN